MLKYLEMEKIANNWQDTGVIDNFEEKVPIALCLQSQRNMNERADLDPAFRRWSIPLLIRVFMESKAFARNHFTNFFDEDERPLIAFLKAKFVPPQDAQREPDLEYEAELIAKLASAVKDDIDNLFRDRKDATITFHGITHSPQGDLMLHYS